MSQLKFLFFLLFVIAVKGFSQSSAHFGGPKFAPEDGQRLLIMGQDLGAVGGLPSHNDGYVNYVDHVPAGITTYTSLNTLGGLINLENWGSGDVHAQAYLEDETFDNSSIAIGLYMVNQLDNIIAGNYDSKINQLGNWIKDSTRPVFLRIGYEFDGPWNSYNSTKFKEAWVHIVDQFDDLEVRNVAYVWQSAGINTANIDRWYPGDEYVNWLGYSHFDGQNSGQSIRTFANQHDKPIMIAEATPRRDLKIGDGQAHWDAWFDPMFESIHNDSRIKALAYINVNWDAQPQWSGQGWGDSRVQVNETIFQNWMNEVSNEDWIMASDTLFDLLQLELWEDSIMMDKMDVLSASEQRTPHHIIVLQNNSGIKVKSTYGKMTAISAYSLSGSRIYESLEESGEYSIPAFNGDGLLILKVIVDDHVINYKILAR